MALKADPVKIEKKTAEDNLNYANNKLVALSKSRITQLMQLKEKILAYNYLTHDDLFPNWGGADPFLKWAAEQGIESRNDIAAAEILNSYKDIESELFLMKE